MIQYETRLQTPGPSRKVSFCKKDIAAGFTPQVYSLVGDKLVLKGIESITNHGKHDLVFVSIGSGKSLQCRGDTELLSPGGWVAVKDLAVDDIVYGVRTSLQRTREGERGAYHVLTKEVDARLQETPITELRRSHIMWSGRRNDVMSVKMIDTYNFVTSTGLVVYGA